jgi:precorrin-2 methylase
VGIDIETVSALLMEGYDKKDPDQLTVSAIAVARSLRMAEVIAQSTHYDVESIADLILEQYRATSTASQHATRPFLPSTK